MQFPMSVKWFELLRKRAGEFRVTPSGRIFRQIQKELPGQAIPGLKESADSFKVEPSAGLFASIQAGLPEALGPVLQEQAEQLRVEPSEGLFTKIQQGLEGSHLPELSEKAASFRIQPSDHVFVQIQRKLQARKRRRVAALLLLLLFFGSASILAPTLWWNSESGGTNEAHSISTAQGAQQDQAQLNSNQGESVAIGNEQEETNSHSHALERTEKQGQTGNSPEPSELGYETDDNPVEQGAGQVQSAIPNRNAGKNVRQNTGNRTARNSQSKGRSGTKKPVVSEAGQSTNQGRKHANLEPLEPMWEKYQARRIEPVFSWSSFNTHWKRPHIGKVYLRSPQRRPAAFSVRGQLEVTALATQMYFSENPDYLGKKSALLNPEAYQDLESRLQAPDFSYQVQAGIEFGFRSLYVRTGLGMLRLTYQQSDLHFSYSSMIVPVFVTDTITFTNQFGVDTTVIYSYEKPELKDKLDTTRIAYSSRASYISLPLALGYRYERGRWFAQADLGLAINFFMEGRGLAYMSTGSTSISPTNPAEQNVWNGVGFDATARLKAGWKLSRRWSAAVHLDVRMGLSPVYSQEHALHQTYGGLGCGFSINHRLY